MIIKTLNIEAFGHFKDVQFDFNNHLNLIEGLNESGKSTLHAFIEGILYGFLDPKIARKMHLEKYDRYEPKESDQYGGSMVIEQLGKLYRIERNLKKRVKNPVRIIEEKTGKEITDTLDLHPTHKVPDLAKWLDLPYLVYLNTLSITQHDLVLNTSLERDLISRLQNLDSTASLSLSIDQAFSSLQKEKDAIGTDNPRSKKPYRETLDQLETLDTEKRKVIERHNTHLSDKAILEEEKDTLRKHEEALKDVIIKLNHQTNQKQKLKFQELEALHKKKIVLNKTLETLKAYQDFDSEDLTHYREANSDQKHLKERISELNQEISQKSIRFQELRKDHPILEEINASLFQRDLYDYQESLDIYNEVEFKGLQETILKLDTQRKKKANKLKRSTKLKAIKKRYIFTLFVWLYGSIASWFIKKSLHQLNKKYETKLAPYEIQNQALKTLTQIQKNYQIRDRFELMTLESRLKEYQEHSSTIASLKKSKDAREVALIQVQENQDLILKKYDVLDYEGLKKFKENYQNYLDTFQEVQHLEALMNQMLQGTDYETFKATIDFNLEAISLDDYQETQKKKIDLDKTIREKQLLITKETQRLISEENQLRPLEAIETDIAYYETLKEQYQNDLSMLENAEARIHRAIEVIEENFAPALSEKIGAYLSRFTLNKYDTIKVRKDLAFKVELSKSKRLESVPYFSQGTLDQIYFAMRLGVLDAMQKNTVPLFLDDAFTAYDEKRLEAVLTLLNELQTERQILLFTCHKREAETLNNLKLSFHYVKL